VRRRARPLRGALRSDRLRGSFVRVLSRRGRSVKRRALALFGPSAGKPLLPNGRELAREMERLQLAGRPDWDSVASSNRDAPICKVSRLGCQSGVRPLSGKFSRHGRDGGHPRRAANSCASHLAIRNDGRRGRARGEKTYPRKKIDSPSRRPVLLASGETASKTGRRDPSEGKKEKDKRG